MKFFVYLDKTDDGRAFYVGRGSKSRVSSTLRGLKHSLICFNHGFNREILFESENEVEVKDYEAKMIQVFSTMTETSDQDIDACRKEVLDGNLGCNRKKEKELLVEEFEITKKKELSDGFKKMINAIKPFSLSIETSEFPDIVQSQKKRRQRKMWDSIRYKND